VSTGAADAAAAPIENSLAGSVHKNYDLLMEQRAYDHRRNET